jgi:type III secretion protein U
MSQDSPEEKKHPPSQRRLAEMRKKGQIPIAQDMRSAGSFLLPFIALVVLADRFSSGLQAMLVEALDVNGDADVGVSSVRILWNPAFFSLGILLVVTFLAVFLGSIVDAGGIIISPSRLKFNLQKINPWHNAKERFKLRSWVDMGLSLLKTLVFIVCATAVLGLHAGDIMAAPFCGLTCVLPLTWQLLLEVGALIALVLLVFGLLDLKISRALFARENKMTDTEMKREQKEDFGSPEIRKKRKEFRNEIAASSKIPAPEQAALILTGRTGAVALYYVEAEAAPPMVVANVDADLIEDLLELAGDHKVRVVHDDDLVVKLSSTRRGDFVPERLFVDVAKVLVN